MVNTSRRIPQDITKPAQRGIPRSELTPSAVSIKTCGSRTYAQRAAELRSPHDAHPREGEEEKCHLEYNRISFKCDVQRIIDREVVSGSLRLAHRSSRNGARFPQRADRISAAVEESSTTEARRFIAIISTGIPFCKRPRKILSLCSAAV